MPNRSLGQMPNAPLAYVLAQVRFSPYLSIRGYIPALQDALRRDYPAFEEQELQAVEFGPAAAAPVISKEGRWRFAVEDGREGFIVQQNSVIFHATKYETYPVFAERHAKVLAAFEKTVPDVFVERLGLRYVDIIVPREGETPEDYVVQGLHGCDCTDLAPRSYRSTYVANWELGDGRLVFRYTSGARPPFFPQDLQPLELDAPDVLRRAQTADPNKTAIGVLDYDRMLNHRGTLRARQVLGLFSTMRDDISKSFLKSQSQLAGEVWKSTQS